MDLNLIAVIVGIVEGLTEFLPVSSTGHMIIVGHVLGFEGQLADVFDVFVQLGAILSVVFIYKERFARFFTKDGWDINKGLSVWHVAGGGARDLGVPPAKNFQAGLWRSGVSLYQGVSVFSFYGSNRPFTGRSPADVCGI